MVANYISSFLSNFFICLISMRQKRTHQTFSRAAQAGDCEEKRTFQGCMNVGNRLMMSKVGHWSLGHSIHASRLVPRLTTAS